MAAKHRPYITIATGDLVLIGAPGVSMPGDWFVATVLLVCGDEVATAHTPAGQSEPQRQFIPVTHIRAAGEYAALREYQDRCREVIGDAHKRVREAEQALGNARDAVWAKLDEIATEIPGATS